MKELLNKFEAKQPEIVFEWKDAETEAEGWVVINSLRGGAAGGGTRMRKGLNKREVESLAKTMEIKFSISGPPIGGAKSGINFDPADPRKEGVLQRWYAAVMPLLKYYYGTGGDLNVDEIHEVIPITEDHGIWHPQEGVFTGHFHPTEAQKVNRIGQLRQGVIKIIEDEKYTPDIFKKYTVADMITGYGVSEAVRHYYNLWSGDIASKKAIIQGWGNVGAAAAFYLAQMGVKVVGIIDRAGGLIKEEGFTFEEIKTLFVNRNGNQLNSPDVIPFEEINAKVWDLKAEIFIPAAASRLITQDQLDRMVNSGLEVISCGANVPFADEAIFYGPISEHADQHVSVIPDFIANCGMARVFAYLMSGEVDMTDDGIFSDTSSIIGKALEAIHKQNKERTLLTNTAFENSLGQLVN
ncbi:MAG: Glu/Leu/Phe/Val dehydrogenase dimerization domain-containing protein [Reichenbachiella sp.]|uniref:Glu/Leu/Phe/Val dehydrogenase dimerization domain-containing protein n=1 Tax=Reichenbachiella sp. TaxID=2184521 RepID=UPI002966531F|nr:Glu/Leu/Phe/Val dehydrogenase dimerization domain-containing protein [Reichenbachiella sp.]MDW3209938.1 Glu/Leu/Phe/Val dehydrogenase dimerization domain-containing protein [Reichenbachiella sp.]